MTDETMAEIDRDGAEALLLRYVAGTLPRPLRAVFSAHLDLKGEDRPLVRAGQALAGEALAGEAPRAIANREARLAAILASDPPPAPAPEFSARAEPRPLTEFEAFIGRRLEEIPWKAKLPGLKEFPLEDEEGLEACLYWIKGSRAIPNHSHEGSEVTLVLEGALIDSGRRYGPGDMQFADPSIDHRPVAEDGHPCICIAVRDAPLRLTGSVYRRVADLINL